VVKEDAASPAALSGYRRLNGRSRATLLEAYHAFRQALEVEHAAWLRQQEVDRRRREYHRVLARTESLLAAPVPTEAPAAARAEPEDVDLALHWCRRDWPDVYRLQSERWRRSGRDVVEFGCVVETDERARREESDDARSAADSADWKLARMLSARLAEKAALAFYMRYDPPAADALGDPREIADVSILQVTNPAEFEPEYDLAYPADGAHAPPRRMDVKNTWRSRRDGWGYERRHTVKKLRTLDGRDITIVGVLSKPEPLATLLVAPAVATVLGETDRTRIDKLENEFAIRTGRDALSLRITIRDTWSPKDESYGNRLANAPPQYRLPPWAYDPLAVFQAPRAAALREVARALAQLREVDPDAAGPELRMCLMAGIEPAPARVQALSASGRALLDDWRERAAQGPLTLARLYLSLLRHFWAQVHRGADQAFDGEEVRSLLYVPGEDGGLDLTSPLGIRDPLQLVSILVDALARLSAHGTDELRTFTRLAFVGSGNLYGWRENDEERWTLMFTHCGRDGASACKHTRLVLGREKHCRGCGRLKCEKCSFCDEKCPCRNQRECRCAGRHAAMREAAALLA
jgi:hypothetical protein